MLRGGFVVAAMLNRGIYFVDSISLARGLLVHTVLFWSVNDCFIGYEVMCLIKHTHYWLCEDIGNGKAIERCNCGEVRETFNNFELYLENRFGFHRTRISALGGKHSAKSFRKGKGLPVFL